MKSNVGSKNFKFSARPISRMKLKQTKTLNLFEKVFLIDILKFNSAAEEQLPWVKLDDYRGKTAKSIVRKLGGEL